MRLSSRQRAILREIGDGSYVEIKDLASRLDVDVTTIRRDLQALVRGDVVLRLHGGVKLREPDPYHQFRTTESSVDERQRAVASTARRMLSHGDSLFLSAGPITDLLASSLLDLEDLVVITNNVSIADRLSQHSSIRVKVAGGDIHDGDTGVTSGPDTARFLAEQRARWCFLEVSGLHPYAGITLANPWRVSATRAMMQAAQRRCLLAPSPVFGVRRVGFVNDVAEADLIITDEQLPDDALSAFAGRIVRGAVDPLDDWHDTGRTAFPAR